MLRRLGELAGLAALVLAVGAALAGLLALGGRWSDWLDVLTHFSLITLALGVVSALLCAGLLKSTARRLGLVAAVVAIAAPSVLMAPEWIAAISPRPTATGPTLKILQFNVWYMTRDPQRSLDWIKKQNADILFIEEANSRAEVINRELRALYPNWSSGALPYPRDVLVLSRLPLLRRQGGRSPSMALGVYRWQGREIVAAAIHDDWPIPPGQQQRQLRKLAGALRNEPKTWMIVSGDFNATPWAFTLRRFDQALGIERRTHGLLTWPVRAPLRRRIDLPSPLPFLAIDQVYAGPGWRTVDVRRGPRLGSDHYPVMVELAPKGA